MLSSIERETELQRRRDMIKFYSDKIGMSEERMRESAEPKEKKNTEIEESKNPQKELKAKKSEDQKRDTLTGKKRKPSSDSSIAVVDFNKKTRMKTTVEVEPGTLTENSD
jgi:hypothetical protein